MSLNVTQSPLSSLSRTPRSGGFSARRTRSNPSGDPYAPNVIPVTINGRHIACDARYWLAVTNAPKGWGEPVTCVKP